MRQQQEQAHTIERQIVRPGHAAKPQDQPVHLDGLDQDENKSCGQQGDDGGGPCAWNEAAWCDKVVKAKPADKGDDKDLEDRTGDERCREIVADRLGPGGLVGTMSEGSNENVNAITQE